MSTRTFKIGTRGSHLAMAQATWIASGIRRISSTVRSSIEVITTSGDRAAGAGHLGDGIFVREIQEALLRGDIDVAVHSMKDLPTQEVEGVRLAAVPDRVDPRDAVIGGTLAGLAPGSRVGTSSPRRVAQMLHLRP
ncbi:MAG TPA: hydroxymethylbilane synthase, partial [Actinomycetota bacterium]|nr:hydroxymethylbilane synthase [Actinomycetota bacterium]